MYIYGEVGVCRAQRRRKERTRWEKCMSREKSGWGRKVWVRSGIKEIGERRGWGKIQPEVIQKIVNGSMVTLLLLVTSYMARSCCWRCYMRWSQRLLSTYFKQNQTSSPYCWTVLIMPEDGESVAGSEFSLIILHSCGPCVQQYNTILYPGMIVGSLLRG